MLTEHQASRRETPRQRFVLGQQDGDRGAADGFRTPRLPFGELVGEHEDRIADPNLGVRDPAIGRGEPHDLGGAEGLLVKGDRPSGPLDDEIGSGGVVSGGDVAGAHGANMSREPWCVQHLPRET
jgi:hypothetical protein